eukprot:scaffold65947_cov36-Attheya_sp.AAC.1
MSKLEKTMTHNKRLRPARKLRIYEARDTPALKVANNPTRASPVSISTAGGTEHYTADSHPTSSHSVEDGTDRE